MFCARLLAAVSPVMERVSGNIIEFEMTSLNPDTQYTVSVYATKDELKSQAATTEFSTGWSSIPITHQSLFS